LAKSSTIPQFSGPFNPLPAETTNSASGSGISPSGFFVVITFIRPFEAPEENSSTPQADPLDYV
jgi:hypothetical protein